MSGGRDRFSLYDFNVECWKAIDDFGERVEGVALPKITLDIWLHVDDVDLHRVIDLLPSLGWEGTEVGMRVEYGPQDEGQLLSRFSVARDKARANTRNNADGSIDFHPTPRVLTEYLRDKLGKEYKLRYYVLDPAKFDSKFETTGGYVPRNRSRPHMHRWYGAESVAVRIAK